MDWLLRKGNVDFFLNIKDKTSIIQISKGIGTYPHITIVSHEMIKNGLLIKFSQGRNINLVFTQKGLDVKKHLKIIKRILNDEN